mgnify:CR=1 FL=1
MRWLTTLNENIKRGVRSWLNVQPASPCGIQIQETADFELNAIRNRIWYRGDGNELEQLYEQSEEYADRYKFCFQMHAGDGDEEDSHRSSGTDGERADFRGSGGYE